MHSFLYQSPTSGLAGGVRSTTVSMSNPSQVHGNPSIRLHDNASLLCTSYRHQSRLPIRLCHAREHIRLGYDGWPDLRSQTGPVTAELQYLPLTQAKGGGIFAVVTAWNKVKTEPDANCASLCNKRKIG